MFESDEYLDKFKKTHKVEDFLAYFSSFVWRKLKFCYEDKNKFDEITITQILITELAEYIKKGIPLAIRIFESKKEYVNGSDFQILLPIGNKFYMCINCQAKRIFSKGKYDSLFHKKKSKQIESLIAYSKQNRAFPAFILYNYDSTLDGKLGKQAYLYGCTIISAKYVQNNFTPTSLPFFKDLYPKVKPLTFLAKSKTKDFLEIFYKSLCAEGDIRNELEFIPERLLAKGDWIELYPEKIDSIRGTTATAKVYTNLDSLTENFNPMYRIIITEQPIKKRII